MYELQVVDEVRLRIGDKEEPYVITDEEISFYLYKNANSENVVDVDQTVTDLAPIMIKNMAAIYVREREGNVEVFAGQKTQNMMDAYKFLGDSGLDTSLRPFATPIIKNQGSSRFSIGMFSERDPYDDY